MVSSAARTVRTYSYISPPFRPVDSAAFRKVSRFSLTWSKVRRAGRQRTSRASNHRFASTIRNEGGQRWPPLVFLDDDFVKFALVQKPRTHSFSQRVKERILDFTAAA